MSRYIPMPAYPDMMPVDISFVFEKEKPAGKHGFIRAEGDYLVFEDGTPAKFWGVNFNGGACFPSKEYAHKVANRLAQAGCNVVRFHQLDAEWDTPNIFSYSKGKRVTTTRALDPKSMDALDYLIYCLKEEGIYCYLDMMTYRKFKEGDDVPFQELLPDSAKPYSVFDPRLIELQKEFCTQIWTHYNPYTKLAYKDDPVFILTEITNECDVFRRFNTNVPYYLDEFRGLFRNWLEKKNIAYNWDTCEFYATDPPMIQFKIELTMDYFRTMYDHIRSIGVKIPIAGTNWCIGYGLSESHKEMDFTDAHPYFFGPSWGLLERIATHISITSRPTVTNVATMRHPNKPFFISEWDMTWPNSYRAESSIYIAALACLQNWSGLAIHTYSYSTRLADMKVLGRELSSPVASVPYREGIFSTWNDPAKFGLFYHAALMLRRGDVSPAQKKLAIRVTDNTQNRPAINAATSGLEQHLMATAFTEELPEGFDRFVLDTETIENEEPGMIRSDNGQLWRDLNKQIGVVDSPRTKVVYGFLGRAAVTNSANKKMLAGLELNGLGVTCATDFGVIALSSLTDDPIEKSDNMLLSAIGRARNTDAVFDGTKMLDVGKPPIMAEVIEADIHLKTDIGDKLKVWGVNAEGFYSGKIPTTYEDGILSFRIGNATDPACYYLIVKE